MNMPDVGGQYPQYFKTESASALGEWWQRAYYYVMPALIILFSLALCIPFLLDTPP